MRALESRVSAKLLPLCDANRQCASGARATVRRSIPCLPVEEPLRRVVPNRSLLETLRTAVLSTLEPVLVLAPANDGLCKSLGMTAAAAPPFSITAGILSLVEQIGEAIGRAEAAVPGLDFGLRRRLAFARFTVPSPSRATRCRRSRSRRFWTASGSWDRRETSRKSATRSRLEASLDAVREGSPQETPHVSPQVERLLRVLDGEMSRREVLEALGLRDRKWLRQAYLGPALKAGLIEMARPETPSARNQRYRLTPAGRHLRGRTP